MNAAKPKQIKVVNLDRQMCTLRFSLDGKLLAAGGQDGTVRRLDATTTDLKPLTPGRYRVVWRVVSVDTHKTNGTFPFRVRPRGRAGLTTH